MAAKSIFRQGMDKGAIFSFLFFLFFIMAAVPILVLFFISLRATNLPGIVLAMVLGGILVHDLRRRDLFVFCRDMIILNATLWFLLGLLSLVKQLFAGLPPYVTYLLLVPYAAISGLFVFTLLKQSEPKQDRERLLKAGVAISSIIAVVSAVNGAMLATLDLLVQKAGSVTPVGQGLLQHLSLRLHNPHVAFVIVIVLFNISFLKHYLKGKRRMGLFYYLFPLATYLVLIGLWQALKGLLLNT